MPNTDRRTRRREATRQEIVDAAWTLAREQGLAGLSLRELARQVGMRAPSLYSYFPSKAAIYDAMFAEGAGEFHARMRQIRWPRDARELLLAGARAFAEFCVDDVVRYQLLFQRTIPDFEPSPASYADAVAVLDTAGELLISVGIIDPAALDLWTAILTGIVDQQLSNDPSGDRWIRLLPQVVDMFMALQGKGRI